MHFLPGASPRRERPPVSSARPPWRSCIPATPDVGDGVGSLGGGLPRPVKKIIAGGCDPLKDLLRSGRPDRPGGHRPAGDSVGPSCLSVYGEARHSHLGKVESVSPGKLEIASGTPPPGKGKGRGGHDLAGAETVLPRPRNEVGEGDVPLAARAENMEHRLVDGKGGNDVPGGDGCADIAEDRGLVRISTSEWERQASRRTG